MVTILQIVPTPPNQSDGIGDYALSLAAQLLKDAQIHSQFLSFRTDVEIDPRINGFAAARLTAHHAEALLAAVPAGLDTIVLHFSGYPYFNTNLRGQMGVGTPFWFVKALEALKRARPLKLIIMFHELPKLYWKQFYFFDVLNPSHSLVSRRLARMADVVLTTSTKYQRILSSWVKRPVRCLAVFSTVGEPDIAPPLAERQRRMVIFGGSARQRVYQNAANRLVGLCHALGIEEIYDIGVPLNLQSSYRFEDIRVNELGFQSAASISQILVTSRAGCLDYRPFPGDLTKSSVLAAYCAHGVLPVLTRHNPSEVDGLYVNQQYVTVRSLSNSRSGDQEIANNAHRWYKTHSRTAIAEVFAEAIVGNRSQLKT